MSAEASTLMDAVGERYRSALASYTATPSLHVAVEAEVEAFFTRYPKIERTRRAELFIAGLALDRITSATLSQPQTQTRAA